MAAAAVGVSAAATPVAAVAGAVGVNVAVEDGRAPSVRSRRIPQLPPEWAQRARDQLGEDASQVERQVRQLRARLNGAKFLEPADMDDAFYIAFLRARKFDQEKTVKLIRRYCDMRQRYPDVCKFAAPSRHLRFHQTQAITLLEDRRFLDAVVVLGKIDHFDLSTITSMYAVRQYYSLLEAVAADPKTQVAGVHLLLDLAGFGFRHARLITPSFVRATVSLTQDSFPLRCKGVHVVNQPFGFDALYNVFKPFLSEKLRKRVRIHGNNWSSLHQYLPPEVLPTMYGGVTPGLDSGPSLKRLNNLEQAMKSLSLSF